MNRILLLSRWQTLWYNFAWPDWVAYIDGWVARFALFVPILGYLILFNDAIADILSFKDLANEEVLSRGLSGDQRLRLVYFGLVFLGVSNLLYRWKKLYQFKFGSNRVDYVRTCLNLFAYQDFLQLHHSIRSEGHIYA